MAYEMNHSIKDIPLQGTSEDTGWKVSLRGHAWTDWKRTMKSTRNPQELAQEMLDNKDYPGWTGVNYAPGLSKDGFVVFTSTWDSSG